MVLLLSNEPILIAAALLAVYIVLGVLYESYIHPITILSTLPSAGVGAVLALMLFNIEFSIIALIGVVLLIGIVKKNAIMMIDVAIHNERSEGLDPREAIYRAALLRFRPIMMTTLAAMLGALPLAIGLGEGAELRRPLGISIVGGLLVSQALTLYTTPVIYYLSRPPAAGLAAAGRRRTPAAVSARARRMTSAISLAAWIRACAGMTIALAVGACTVGPAPIMCASRRRCQVAFKEADPERWSPKSWSTGRWRGRPMRASGASGGRSTTIRCSMASNNRSTSPNQNLKAGRGRVPPGGGDRRRRRAPDYFPTLTTIDAQARSARTTAADG